MSLQSLGNKGRLHPDVKATLDRAASLRASALAQLRVLVENELRVGLSIAEAASRTNNVSKAERRRAMARHAYDCILRLTSRTPGWGVQSKQFSKDLRRLKIALRELGEDI